MQVFGIRKMSLFWSLKSLSVYPFEHYNVMSNPDRYTDEEYTQLLEGVCPSPPFDPFSVRMLMPP